MDLPRSLRLLYRATAAFMADVMRLYAVCWSWVGLLARSSLQVMVAAATCSWGTGASCGAACATPGPTSTAAASAAMTTFLRQGVVVRPVGSGACRGVIEGVLLWGGWPSGRDAHEGVGSSGAEMYGKPALATAKQRPTFQSLFDISIEEIRPRPGARKYPVEKCDVKRSSAGNSPRLGGIYRRALLVTPVRFSHCGMGRADRRHPPAQGPAAAEPTPYPPLYNRAMIYHVVPLREAQRPPPPAVRPRLPDRGRLHPLRSRRGDDGDHRQRLLPDIAEASGGAARRRAGRGSPRRACGRRRRPPRHPGSPKAPCSPTCSAPSTVTPSSACWTSSGTRRAGRQDWEGPTDRARFARSTGCTPSSRRVS